MLKSRVITAVVLVALLLLALFALPAFAWTALIVVMLMQGTVEWGRLSKLSHGQSKVYWGVTLLLLLGLLWGDSRLAGQTQIVAHLLVYAVSALLWLIIVPTWMMIGTPIKNKWCLCVVGWAVLIPTGLAMIDLRQDFQMFPGAWVLLALMCLVWVADSSAYFAGRRFGKNKLAPTISPGKTWEGVGGAMLGVTVYIVLVWLLNPFYNQPGLIPELVLAGWWWVGLAVIGDLFESFIKRQAGVKDSGALLPGHGGLLDRIDALTSTLPLAAMAILFQKLI